MLEKFLLQRARKEILAALPPHKGFAFARRQRNLDLSKPTDPERVAKALKYAQLVAHSRPFAVAGAFSARLMVLLLGLASNTVFRIAREHCLAENSMSPIAVAKLLDEWVPPIAARIAAKWQLPMGLCGVLAAPAAPGLGRSLHFGRLAGALLILVNRGHMRELSARAVVLADDRRPEVDRLWSRIAITHLAATR